MQRARTLLLLVAACVLPRAAAAQRPDALPEPPVDRWLEYTAGDEFEEYLRSLQALGVVATRPWSLRAFSPASLDRIQPATADHPWSPRIGAASGSRWRIVRPRLQSRYNSTFPFGGNDGAIWAGRGATVAISGGVAARWGVLSLTVQPIAFWSQNQAFDLRNTGRDGPERFADPSYPGSIDRPQRFGDAAYSRIDPGQSTLRIDAFGATLGVSTANEWWGPAQEFPFLLGTNAAGFPHVFVGTTRPVDLWIARAETRLIYGKLSQSEYFVPTGPLQRPRRFASGLLVVLTPRGLDNLEIGGARFFHAPWPDEGMPGRYLARPFEGLFKTSLPEVDGSIDTDSRSIDGENQLASVFARLVLPRTGFEIYGEIGREDHPWDLRHLILSPDEQSTFTIGLRKSWRRPAGRMGVVRAEAMNFQQRQVDRRRLGPATYVHASGSNQGHTERGQLLGADVGVGSAAGAVVGVDLLDGRGRTSFEWRRVVRQEDPHLAPDGGPNRRALDVIHTIGAERLLFRGGTELLAGVDLSYNFDRDFARDRMNVSVRLAAAGLPW